MNKTILALLLLISGTASVKSNNDSCQEEWQRRYDEDMVLIIATATWLEEASSHLPQEHKRITGELIEVLQKQPQGKEKEQKLLQILLEIYSLTLRDLKLTEEQILELLEYLEEFLPKTLSRNDVSEYFQEKVLPTLLEMQLKQQ